MGAVLSVVQVIMVVLQVYMQDRGAPRPPEETEVQVGAG